MQRCRVALYLPTRCRVPSSAHDLPRLSPVGTKPDAHRIGSRAPLGLALRAAELQVCIPMVCPIPQTAGRPLPAYPFPLAGRLSVSLHTLVRCSLRRWLLCRRLPNPTRTWGRRSASWLIRRRRGLLLGFERLCSNSRRRPSTVVFRGWAGSTILGFRAHQAACVALMICNSQFQRATRFTAA